MFQKRDPRSSSLTTAWAFGFLCGLSGGFIAPIASADDGGVGSIGGIRCLKMGICLIRRVFRPRRIICFVGFIEEILALRVFRRYCVAFGNQTRGNFAKQGGLFRSEFALNRSNKWREDGEFMSVIIICRYSIYIVAERRLI